MKLKKLFISSAIVLSLFGFGASLGNSNANAAKIKRVNGYMVKMWPTVLLDNAAIVSNKTYQSDKSNATYMKYTVITDDNFKLTVVKEYYDKDGNSVDKDQVAKNYSVPYLKQSAIGFTLASSTKNPKNVFKLSPSLTNDKIVFFKASKINGKETNDKELEYTVQHTAKDYYKALQIDPSN